MAMKKRQKKLVIGLSCLLAVVIAGGATAAVLFNRKDEKAPETSWSEVMADNTLPQIESENFGFSTSGTLIKIPDVEALSTFKVNQQVNSREDIEQKLPEIAEIVFGDLFKSTKISFEDFISGGFEGSLSESKDNDSYNVRLSSDNSFIAYKTSTVAHSSMTGKPVDISRLDDGKPLSDRAYEMGTEPYTMQQALALCVDMMDKLSPYLDGLEYKPTRVIVFERDDMQGYAFRVEFSAYKNDVPLHDSYVTGQLIEDSNIKLNSHCVYMLITEPDVIGAVCRCTGADLIEEKKIENGYITLSEATELLADYYAPLYKHIIEEVSIEYVIADKLKTITLDEEGLEGLEVSVVDSSVVEPYWCFRIEDTPESNYENAYCREEQKIFVNMLTGKVYTYHNS